MTGEESLKELNEGCVIFDSFNQEIVSKEMPIFYNPKMRENRDLSILMILYLLNENSKKRRLAFPMTASGIRELRLLSEHRDFFEKNDENYSIGLFVNDINAESLGLAKKNILRANNSNVEIKYFRCDARTFLLENKHFDYVEIDPFGTPIPFIDSALQSLKDNSIIGVTATDTSALTGTYPKATLRKYGSIVILSPSMHEISIRIFSSFIIRRAASLGLGAQVLFSYSDEHYLKVFFRIRKGKGRADDSLEKLKDILLCEKCGMFYDNETKCDFCTSENIRVGPLYMGELWDSKVLDFVNSKLEEKKQCEFSNRLRKNVIMINEENELMKKNSIRLDVHMISSVLKLKAVPKMDTLRKIIEDKNHVFSRSIFNEKMIRTTIKPIEFKDILLNI